MKRIILVLFLLFVIPSVAEAKLLPRFTKTSPPKKVQGVSYVTAKLRADRKALNVTFSNLKSVKSLEYSLYYDANGTLQGVTGSVDTSGGINVSRELVFGTCSKGVCTYHTGIKNMKFEVTIELNSGKKFVKKYKVKV